MPRHRPRMMFLSDWCKQVFTYIIPFAPFLGQSAGSNERKAAGESPPLEPHLSQYAGTLIPACLTPLSLARHGAKSSKRSIWTIAVISVHSWALILVWRECDANNLGIPVPYQRRRLGASCSPPSCLVGKLHPACRLSIGGSSLCEDARHLRLGIVLDVRTVPCDGD